MARILKFHCNNCGGENLIFHATAKWDGVRFDLKQVNTHGAYCKDCVGHSLIFQSEEVVPNDLTKPQSDYNPMNRSGNL